LQIHCSVYSERTQHVLIQESVGTLDMEPPCTKHILSQYRGICPQCSPLARSCDSRCDLISSRLRRLFLPSGPWGRNHSPDPCLPSIPSHPEDWSLCLCLDETLACSRWPSLTSTPIRHDRCSRQGSNASCPPRRGATAAQVDLGTGFPKGYDCGNSILPSHEPPHAPAGPVNRKQRTGLWRPGRPPAHRFQIFGSSDRERPPNTHTSSPPAAKAESYCGLSVVIGHPTPSIGT
jgi:hypothetical protein